LFLFNFSRILGIAMAIVFRISLQLNHPHFYTKFRDSTRKPAPDVFLKAAKNLNTDPQNCLVIEDHALGIKAAHEADMPVLGFAGGTHARSDEHRQWLSKARPMAVVNGAGQLLSWFNETLES
jgi:beta-phosphoglucomutase-like phosphatase (HAD superfamily)